MPPARPPNSAGWLVGWLAGLLVGWLAGWLVGGLAGPGTAGYDIARYEISDVRRIG